MEANSSSADTNQLIDQKIRKLGNFSRITGYLYLIITTVPILVLFLTSFFLKTKSPTNHTHVVREDLTIGMGYNNAIGDSLKPLLPVFIFGFITFIILNIFLIYISNQIIKYSNQEINKQLKGLLIVSILILIIFSPLLISILSPLAILDIKIISDTYQIKKSLK